MAPRVIESDLFKHRKEIDKESLEKLIVKGGPLAIKETLKAWGYDETDKVAVPTIVVAGDGRIGGVKWTVIGKASKKVTIKALQLWPEGCEEDVPICMEVPEFDNFNFYNKYRNTSGWIDSTELSWTVIKKNEKGKKVTMPPTNYPETGIQGFSIRMGVLPVSVNSCTITMAILSRMRSRRSLQTSTPRCTALRFHLSWGRTLASWTRKTRSLEWAFSLSSRM